MEKRDLIPEVPTARLTIAVVGVGLIAFVLASLRLAHSTGSTDSSHAGGTVAASGPTGVIEPQLEAIPMQVAGRSPTTVAVPVWQLEREMGAAKVIAEVEIAEVYSATFHTETGLPPTRPVPPGEPWTASCEAEFYVPVRLRVLELFRTDRRPTPDGFLIAEYAGTIADFEVLSPPGWARRLMDLEEIAPGDRGLAALYYPSPEGHGICNSRTIEPRLEREAERLRGVGLYYVVGYSLGHWWPYHGGEARSAEHPALSVPLDELRSGLREGATTGE